MTQWLIFQVAFIELVVDVSGTFRFVLAAHQEASKCHHSAARIHHHPRDVQQLFHVLSHICRGGGGKDDRPHRKSDDEIDAYIESLIASVDTSDDEDDEEVEDDDPDYGQAEATTPKHGSTPEEGDDNDNIEDNDDDDIAAEVCDSLETTHIHEEKDTEDGEATQEEEKEVEDEESSALEVDDGTTDDKDENIDSHANNAVTNTEIANAEEATENPENDTASTASVPEPEEQPETMIVVPPNAFFRFLLHRGRVGHVLVTILLMLAEWISLYLPFLGKLLAAVASYIFPSALLRPTRRPEPPTIGIQQQRTGASAKQTKARTRQADREAFIQLQKVGDVESAKYRYVSLDFQKRHGLGPFREAQLEPTEGESKEESIVESVQRKRNALVENEAVADDEDVNWIVEALTKEKPKQHRKSSIKPTISVEIGSAGPSVSFGVSTGENRRSSVVQAVASASRRKAKQKSPGPRLSDRDGGDGIFGRLRAVAGADSVLSRSILGAYPGDAVPPSEAASPEGVTELARKYGWGEWSDEENDEDQDNEGDTKQTEIRSQKSTRKRIVRRRRKGHPIDINDSRRRVQTSTDFPSIDHAISSRKRRHTEIQVPKPPLFSSSVLTKSSSRPVPSPKIRMVRPAMDLLQERQRARKKENPDED
jgi:hypothetical protein